MDWQRQLGALLASGGDERIVLDPKTGRNRYGAAPWPAEGISYASSTANDLSAPALAHLLAKCRTPQPRYADRLEDLRHRLRTAYNLTDATDIVFAPSGTDLEFAALAIAAGRHGRPVSNILLGADEVGSGCAMAAQGRHFSGAHSRCRPGEPVAGLGERTAFVQLPLRDAAGRVRDEADLADDLWEAIEQALAGGRTPLLHVVHGSKLGLNAPSPAVLDALLAEFGPRLSVVADACQARLGGEAIRRYLDRGLLVMLTGSKFIGGPPFSGMLLIPSGAGDPDAPLPEGLAGLFNRAEWPRNWCGAEVLPAGINPGLAFRLEAALFELERFAATPPRDAVRVIAAFVAAVDQFADAISASILHGSEDPLARTLRVLDLSGRPDLPDHDAAVALHRRLMADGFRFGQPVRLANSGGGLRPILRAAISMPQIVALAAIEPDCVRLCLDRDFATAAALMRLAEPVSA